MKYLIILSLSLLTFSLSSRGQYLDSSFNGIGAEVTDIDGQEDEATAVLALPDNSIIAAGHSNNIYPRICLVKYLADGTPDASFGNGGKAVTSFGNPLYAQAIARQPDGKLVVAGAVIQAGIRDLMLARYNTNGMLDTSFGTYGIVITAFSNLYSEAHALALQPDGKIVAVGAAWNNTESIIVARYNPDGTPDPTFNSTGVVSTNIPGTQDKGNGVVIQPDGKIVVAGTCDSLTSDVMLARYNTDGTTDSSFGGLNTGYVRRNVSMSANYANAIAMQPDGKLVVGGYLYVDSEPTDYDILLERFNSNGIPDVTFNSTGYNVIRISNHTDECMALAIQQNGKIVAAGVSSTNHYSNAALVRLLADGTPDPDFNGGHVLTHISPAFNEWFSAVCVDHLGRIIAAGTSTDSGQLPDIIVARYTGDPTNVKQTTQSHLNPTIYPVPLTNSATIQYELHSPGTVTINIYDVTGRLVKNIATNERQTSGRHTKEFSTAELAKGVYTIKVSSDEGVETVEVVK